jgi:hypothetical protein
MMTDETAGEFNVTKELDAANERLPIDLSQMQMPLDMQVRSIALTIAQRHCGDTTVKEGNLYQQLKMDNKLVGPLTIDHVVRCALIFERFLWGEWSKGLAAEAVTKTLDEVDQVLSAAKDEADKTLKEFNEPPTRSHSGGT